MKIGVLADTHIPDRAADLPPKIAEEFKRVDLIIHAGDFTNKSVWDKLKTMARVMAVYGNMDSLDLVERLPRREIIKCRKFTIGVFHGKGNPAGIIEQLKSEFKDDKVDIIIFGHSHKAMNEKIGNIVFFNPGSPTDTIFSPFKSFGIIEINDKIEAQIIRLEDK